MSDPERSPSTTKTCLFCTADELECVEIWLDVTCRMRRPARDRSRTADPAVKTKPINPFNRAKAQRKEPMQRQNRRVSKGFTLIEILIVVIILGILAAIVIPQFTNASKEAKQSSLVTMVQSLRSQIALFKLQHNDLLPGANPLVSTAGAFDETVFWNQITQFSDLTGGVSATKDVTHVYGPYMQSIPVNPLNNSSTVAAAAAVGVGFVYDYNGGEGSGKVWGVDSAGAQIAQ